MTKSILVSGNIYLTDTTATDTTVFTSLLDITETYTEIVYNEVVVPKSTTDQVISLNGVATARLILIIPTYGTSGTPSNYLTATINAGTEDISFGKILAVGGTTTTGTTAIKITNPDTVNDATLKIWIV